jgi:rubrerythrin
VSRRGLLGAGVTLAAAGTGAALAGCERSQPAPPYYGIQDTDETIDLAQLNEAVDLEYMAIAAYGAAMPLLRGADLALGRRLLAQERQHLDLLLGVFHHVSVTPDQPRASYGFPRLRDSAHALAFAAEIENTAIATYIDALPKIVDPMLRVKFATIMTSEAEHLAVLAGARGMPEAPTAFVTGAIQWPVP